MLYVRIALQRSDDLPPVSSAHTHNIVENVYILRRLPTPLTRRSTTPHILISY
jgi:hypothetical protein